MDTIIYRQKDAARPLSGRTFLLAIAGIALRLAAAQIVVNFLIVFTGVGLLNLAFYLYAVWLLFAFMRKTVANYVYTLKGDSIVLERRLGDSPITVISVPVSSIVSVRPVKKGERLKTVYRQVTEIDPACKPPLRVRAAFVLSLFSARQARRCAGSCVEETAGHVLVFDEDRQRRALVFAPDARMQEALAGLLGDVYGFDERMVHGGVKTLFGRALERAFPALYPYVEPLVSREEVEQARRDVNARAEARRARKSKKTGAGLKAQKSVQTEEAAQTEEPVQTEEAAQTEEPAQKQQDGEAVRHRRRKQE